MRAVRFYGRRDVRMDQVEDLGSPKPGWVRLKVDACGICGTDLEGYVNGPDDREYAGKGILTLGHEGAGTVVETGEGVSLAIGQRVAVEGHLFCRECFYCLRGDYALCVRLKSLGQGADGGLAEEMLAPEYMCLPYADSLEPHHAALAEPTSVAVRAVRRGRLAAGETVVVVGGGTIGLLLLQIVRLRGAARVVVVEPVASRRELALRLGADQAVAPDDAQATLDELTSGVGADVAFEAGGSPAAAKAAVELVRKGGRTVLLGVTGGSLELPLLRFLLTEKEVIASLSHTYDVDFPEALRLLESGQVVAEPLITDRIGLDQVVSHGFEALLAEPAAHLKVLVVP
ncbi:zinc-binding dehydrogenase [Tenggerimyces flavus]|uniref:Zinc-binding dehydrogenase n=1 Tax=Tenggerimyces flavus TaxID=1708749 RepID=A0ABV7YGR0_9ACTN|nr:zinc-binding dehydrogenase [Tenggerimyces flavus]MBM7783916.1 (R,R)-butanediol dehydrogenase/meso-butanediol dehydrogenase/diacetyl reductase [Tenggerimyces flavus]